MANPQPTDAHLRISHSIMEEIMMRDFSKRQRNILDFILRLSWGCGRKDAIIPKMKYFELCGVSDKKIKEELDYLISAKVIFWIKETNTFYFNKNYDEWKISIIKGYNKELLKELIHLNLKNSIAENPPKMGVNSPKQGESPRHERGGSPPKRGGFSNSTEVFSNDVDGSKEIIKESIKYIITTKENSKENFEISADLIQNEKDQLGADPNDLEKSTHLDADSRELDKNISHLDADSKDLESNHSSADLEDSKENPGAVPGNENSSEDFFSKLESHYYRCSRRLFNSKDQQIAVIFYESYPLDFILMCMDKVYKAKKESTKINSLSYFKGVIEDEWEKMQIKNKAKIIELNHVKKGVKDNEPRGSVKQEIPKTYARVKLPENIDEYDFSDLL